MSKAQTNPAFEIVSDAKHIKSKMRCLHGQPFAVALVKQLVASNWVLINNRNSKARQMLFVQRKSADLLQRTFVMMDALLDKSGQYGLDMFVNLDSVPVVSIDATMLLMGDALEFGSGCVRISGRRTYCLHYEPDMASPLKCDQHAYRVERDGAETRRVFCLTFNGLLENFNIISSECIHAFFTAHCDNGIVKDVVRENEGVPSTYAMIEVLGLGRVSLDRILRCENKRMLVEQVFRRKYPPLVNRIPIEILMKAAPVASRLSAVGKEKFWQQALRCSEIMSESDVCNLGVPYKLLYPEAFEPLISHFEDMVDQHGAVSAEACNAAREIDRLDSVCIDLNRMLRVDGKRMPHSYRSADRIMREHDELAVAQRRRKDEARLSLRAPDDGRFDKYTKRLETDGWMRLVTGEQMLVEGERQHNCIYSYAESMARGFYAFYTIDHESGRHSLQIDRKGKVVQLFKAYNEVADDELSERVGAVLRGENAC